MFDNIIALISRWSPRRIMMDFEKAAMNVVDATFPGIEMSGCFFHLTQSVQRFLQVKFLTQTIKIVLFCRILFRIMVLNRSMKQILHLPIAYIKYWLWHSSNQSKLLMVLNLYVRNWVKNIKKFLIILRIIT